MQCTKTKEIAKLQDAVGVIDKQTSLLNNSFKEMNKKLDKIENTFEKKTDQIIKKLDGFIKESDKKYAKKESVDRLYKFLWTGVGFVLAAVGAGVLGMVFSS